MNNKNKFKIWDNKKREFIYTSFGNQQHKQFIGIYDKNLTEIYEGDVVRFVLLSVVESENIYPPTSSIRKEELIGVVNYKNDTCSYFIGDHVMSNLDFSSFEVVDHIENYTYDDSGHLVQRADNAI